MNALWWTDSDLPLRSRGCALLYPGATMPRAPFENRTQAGRELADALRAMDPTGPLVVLALPRGAMLATRAIARADVVAALQPQHIQLDRFVEGWYSDGTQAALRALLAKLGK